MAGSDSEPLVAQLEDKDPFHENRWRCIFQPEQAALTLGPTARLDLTLVKARGLMLMKTGIAAATDLLLPDPCAKVLLNDSTLYQTAHVNNTSEPEWNHAGSIDITVPTSMVRLHVYDVDFVGAPNPIGFVEFCVGDMPFDKDIDGWLELRFPENLQGSNVMRYADHCEHREDGAYQNSKSVHLDDETRKMRVKKSKVQRCFGLWRKRPGASISDGFQYNAGEILVHMRLVQLGSHWDGVFALSLDALFMEFQTFVQEEKLKELDLQDIIDAAVDIKFHIVDDAVLCVATCFLYIILWRSWMLSGGIALYWLVALLHRPFLHYHIPVDVSVSALVHGLAATMLIICSIEPVRMDLTTGGWNAQLTEEGFEHVARWNNIGQMHAFILRVVAARGGVVIHEQDLYEFVGRCARSGKPLASLEATLELLRHRRFVELPDELIVTEGMLVRVDERRRARVVQVFEKNRKVKVQYEGYEDKITQTVSTKRVTMRITAPNIPAMFIPKSVEHWLRVTGHQTEKLKRVVYPVVAFLDEVLTWKRPSVTLPILTYFSMRCLISGGSLLGFSHSLFLLDLLRLMKGIVVTLACSYLLFSFAQPLAWVRSLGRICVRRAAAGPRQAPEGWAFFAPPLRHGEAV